MDIYKSVRGPYGIVHVEMSLSIRSDLSLAHWHHVPEAPVLDGARGAGPLLAGAMGSLCGGPARGIAAFPGLPHVPCGSRGRVRSP